MYGVWNSMNSRCGNPNNPYYKHYGGRGIAVCERWSCEEGFINFLEDMGDRPDGMSIDRIDNDKGYSLDNCRWVNNSIQTLNQRRITASNRSGYRGVGFASAKGKYRVGVTFDSIKYFIGHFEDVYEAALAYDCAAIQIHGDDANLNIL